MQEQLQTIMDTIVMPIVASLGGITGIVAIVTTIARVATSAKANNKAFTVATATKTEVSTLLQGVIAEVSSTLESKLNCQFEVDFSAKLNEELKALEERLITLSESQAERLLAVKVLMTDIAQMYTTSRNMSEEERIKLLKDIAEVNALVVEKPKEELKRDVVVIEYKPDNAVVETATQAVKVEPKQTMLRGI